MKITRTINGQKITIELTKEEMCRAYYDVEKDYYREDIEVWLENNEKEVDDEFKDKMFDELVDNYDSNISHWDNIANAYDEIKYYNDKEDETMKYDYIINAGSSQDNCLPVASARIAEEGIAKASRYVELGQYAEVVYMPEDDDGTNEVVWHS